jgi:hypothetical protein
MKPCLPAGIYAKDIFWKVAALIERSVLGVVIQRQLYGIKNAEANLHSRLFADFLAFEKQTFNV